MELIQIQKGANLSKLCLALSENGSTFYRTDPFAGGWRAEMQIGNEYSYLPDKIMATKSQCVPIY